jgi:hypothetical protein
VRGGINQNNFIPEEPRKKDFNWEEVSADH